MFGRERQRAWQRMSVTPRECRVDGALQAWAALRRRIDLSDQAQG
jgi:hypothetical protein